MRSVNRRLLGGFAAVAMSAGAILCASWPASATETTDVPACTTLDVQSGTCLVAAVSQLAGTSPVRAAVAQELAAGQRDRAVAFVRARGKLTRDADQTAIERLVEPTSAQKSVLPGVEVAPGSEADESNSSAGSVATVVGPDAASGLGTVSGYIHDLKDTVNYLYCSTSGCTLVGQLAVRFTTNLTFHPDITLDGELDVVRGPSVVVSDLWCRTRDDINNAPDVTVHTWSNCPKVESTTPSSWRTVYPANWTQGGGKGEKYFNEYGLSFHPYVSGARTFTFKWQTNRWYIPSSGHAYWLQ